MVDYQEIVDELKAPFHSISTVLLTSILYLLVMIFYAGMVYSEIIANILGASMIILQIFFLIFSLCFFVFALGSLGVFVYCVKNNCKSDNKISIIWRFKCGCRLLTLIAAYVALCALLGLIPGVFGEVLGFAYVFAVLLIFPVNFVQTSLTSLLSGMNILQLTRKVFTKDYLFRLLLLFIILPVYSIAAFGITRVMSGLSSTSNVLYYLIEITGVFVFLLVITIALMTVLSVAAKTFEN